MMDYKAIYYKKPSDSDLIEIKKEFNSRKHISSWEDYYWASKCLCTYDDDFDARLVNSMMNNAIKFGLTYRLNKVYYLDAMKVLATLNTQLGNYDVVLNYLQTLLEYDENSPDWVYHDFVTAQIHTNNIRRILRNPKMFLSDLSKNDDDSEEVKHRQRNIFKDLLVEGIGYLKENQNSEVNVELLSVAASKYNVDKSAGWNQFVALAAGKDSVISDSSKFITKNNYEREQCQSNNYVKDSRPLIVSLFPEDKVTAQVPKLELDSAYSVKQAELQEKENEIEKHRQELDKRDIEIAKRSRELEKKDIEIEHKAQDVERELLKLDNKIKELEAKKSELGSKTQELEISKTELEKKNQQIKELSHQKEELSKEKKRWQLKAQTNDTEKAKLLEQIEADEKEKTFLKAENEKLRQAKEDWEKSSTNNIQADVISHMNVFLFNTQVDLKKWLERKLPTCSNDWWNECVVGKLDYYKRQSVHDNRISSLEDFDLSVLLKIFRNNWRELKSNGGLFLTYDEKECVNEMLNVRNRWAHVNISSLNSSDVKDDLKTIKVFMALIGSNTDTRKEVAVYLRKVCQLELN